jgi:hypothetical protein
VTEAVYFENYRGASGPSIKIVLRPKDPCKLVEKAIAERKLRVGRGESIDETWIVLDRDVDFDRNNGLELFCKALRIARESGIEVAYSDDAFELWYVLHYQDVTLSVPRTELVKLVEKHCGHKYVKGAKGDLYTEILHLRPMAIKRAHALLKRVEGQPESVNPSTRVHILVEKLIDNNPKLQKS